EIYIQAGHYAESIRIDRDVSLIAMNGDVPGGAVTVDGITLAAGANTAGSSGVSSDSVTVQDGAIVQQGIDLAASGGVVTVKAGTYAGPVVVNKSLTLQAENQHGAQLDFS